MSMPSELVEFVEKPLRQPPEYLFFQAERFERIVQDMRLYTRLHNMAMSRLIAACEEEDWVLLDDRVEPSASTHKPINGEYQRIEVKL
jgi:hypothetical protein